MVCSQITYGGGVIATGRIPAVEGQGVANVDEAYQLRNKTVRLLGDDILIEGEL